MAGSLIASVHHHRGNAVAAPEFSRWQISYARFVQFPSSPSPYPGLKPVGKRELYYPPYGTWLSTSSSNVSLQLVDEFNRSDVILSVQLGGKLLVGMRMEVREIEGPNSQNVIEEWYSGPCHAMVPHCWCCKHLEHCWSGTTGHDFCNMQCNLSLNP